MNWIFLVHFNISKRIYISIWVCITGIFEGGDMVQHRWRDLWRRILALFLHTGCRTGKCSKRFNWSTWTTRKTSQIASVFRRTMDYNRRSDIRRKWASRISFSSNGDSLFLSRLVSTLLSVSFCEETICRILLDFPRVSSDILHIAWPKYWPKQ